jgi:hypothetical protein
MISSGENKEEQKDDVEEQIINDNENKVTIAITTTTHIVKYCKSPDEVMKGNNINIIMLFFTY